MTSKDPVVSKVLSFCGIQDEHMRKDAYQHWSVCLKTIKDNTGMDAQRIKIRCRASVGVDYRYLDAYFDAFLDFGVIKKVDNTIHFVGIPSAESEAPKDKEAGTFDPRY